MFRKLKLWCLMPDWYGICQQIHYLMLTLTVRGLYFALPNPGGPHSKEARMKLEDYDHQTVKILLTVSELLTLKLACLESSDKPAKILHAKIDEFLDTTSIQL